MKICFTGDLFLGGDLLNKNSEKIIDVDLFKNSDKRIVNLEQPISDNDIVEEKCTLFTGSYAVSQLKSMKIDAVNLAHNHIQDKGVEGITETVKHLNIGNIGHFGAGTSKKESKQPYFITNKVAVFGYCEFDKPYLKQIEVANQSKAGVNPLRYKNIISDLNSLKNGQKAILYFHWGREHVFLPPYSDIELARKLLEDDRVLSIIGMHAHRPQGYIKHNNKKAYMCLGNFLFPNFYMKHPTQIYYPDEQPEDFETTRQYHSVFKTTYKKWRWINRISLILEFDTEINNIKHKLVMQDDNEPCVKELSGIQEKIMMIFIGFLSLLYTMPKIIYSPIEKANSYIYCKIWKGQIICFLIKQLGIIKFIKEVKERLLCRIKKYIH